MTMEFLKTFKFRKERNVIYDLDPRTKLVILVVYSFLSLLFQNLFILLFLFITLLPYFLLARSFRKFIIFNKSLSIMIFFIFIINIFFFDIDFALSMIVRLLILMDAFLLFFTTIHPDELAQSLHKLKIPFHYAYTISLATRFIPNLAEESRTIHEAQMARGIDFQEGGLLQKIKKFVPLLVPLFVSSIRKAHLIAEGLEARGFNTRIKRTFLYEIKFKKIDILLLFSHIILLILCLLFYFPVWWHVPSLTQIIKFGFGL